MPNSGPPNSYLECKQQLVVDCIVEVKDWRKGNLPGLDSPLQHRDWSCLPFSIVDSLFKRGDGTLRHLPTWHIKVVLFRGRLCSESPQLHQISLHCHHPLHLLASWQWALLAIDGPGQCPLCQQHPDFPLATRHLLCPQGCKFTMHRLASAGGRFLAHAQKAIYNEG